MEDLKDEDLGEVRGVVVRVVCFHCKGAKRYPGGPYKDQGEVVNCHVCGGCGTTPKVATVEQLKKLLTTWPA